MYTPSEQPPHRTLQTVRDLIAKVNATGASDGEAELAHGQVCELAERSITNLALPLSVRLEILSEYLGAMGEEVETAFAQKLVSQVARTA